MFAPTPSPTSVAASYSRYSSDLQQAESIDDQRRKCREHAARLGLTVDPRFEFADQAVSGTKLAREGLDRLLAAARQRLFHVLFVENLSRLARESVITMPLLKELVALLGIRFISVGEGIDTDRPNWELSAAILSLQHERFVKDLGTYVFRGQEGVVLAGLSVGDACFGYASEPIEGSEANRRGRNPKPRKKYVIDAEAAPWVVRIFDWFVREKWSIAAIARELTRLGAPKDHRATTAAWHPNYVHRVLENTKYIGHWPWGTRVNRRNPFDGKVSQDRRAPEECDKWLRRLPGLQIIDDPTWDAAQRRLVEIGGAFRGTRRKNGQLAGAAPDRAEPAPRHLLAGLLRCDHCGSNFHVAGARGEYLGCAGYKTGRCDCETRAPRDRVGRMILDAIAARILDDPDWRRDVRDRLRAEHEALDRELPARLAEVRKQEAELELKVARLLDLAESGQAPPDLRERLDRRRAEARALGRARQALERAEADRLPEPTEAWVDEQFRALGAVFAAGGPAAALALRGLVGGQVLVRRIERPGRRRHYLQARFTIRAAAVIRELGGPGAPGAGATPDGGPAPDDGRAEEIVLDLRELAPWEQIADRAKALWDQGLNNETIAERLGCHGNQVTKAITAWHRDRGLEPPDGRRRWRQLARESGPLIPEPPPPPAEDPGRRSAS